MAKTNSGQLAAIKGFLKQSGNYESKPVAEIRREMAVAAANLPGLPGIAVEKTAIGRLSGEWVGAAEPAAARSKQAIVYFHGGGFVAGTCESYRDLASRIAQSCGVKVLTVEYRLAPEHPYPAANEDCLDTYRSLLANGYAACDIVFGGDSIGGTLALMTLLSLRDAGESLPAGAFLLSPHTDLVHLDGESYRTRAELDPTGSLAGNQRILNAYWGSRLEEKPPLLSPLRMELAGLPDIFIQVGDHEVLLSDAERFADRARAAGVAVSLEVWENMWSVFQFFAYVLPEAQEAIANIGRFVRAKLN